MDAPSERRKRTLLLQLVSAVCQAPGLHATPFDGINEVSPLNAGVLNTCGNKVKSIVRCGRKPPEDDKNEQPKASTVSSDHGKVMSIVRPKEEPMEPLAGKEPCTRRFFFCCLARFIMNEKNAEEVDKKNTKQKMLPMGIAAEATRAYKEALKREEENRLAAEAEAAEAAKAEAARAEAAKAEAKRASPPEVAPPQQVAYVKPAVKWHPVLTPKPFVPSFRDQMTDQVMALRERAEKLSRLPCHPLYGERNLE